MKFSDRLLRMKPSATRASADKAEALMREGKRIISFTIGEPDFPSPQSALDAATKAMREQKTHYTPTGGIKELKDALIDYYRDRHGVTFTGKEICVGSGAKPVIYEALGALVNPGDEVIIPTPAWVSYVEQVDVYDGKSVLVDTCDDHFQPSLSAIENAVTPRTVAIIVNSPQNPTGVVYSRQFMADLCRLAMKHGFVIINDEVYERLTYGVRYMNPLADVPEARSHVLSINGTSKTYAMTGWRIGYGLGDEKLIAKIATLQGHVTSCACSVSQWGAVGALHGAQADVEAMRDEYEKRMELVYAELATMPHIRVTKPHGAFYFFIDVRPTYGKMANAVTINDDQEFCSALLDSGVALVPGAAFLAPGFARLSYACSMDTLREGLAAMRSFLGNLRPENGPKA